MFPLTEGPYLDPMRFESGDRAPRIPWKKVAEIWKKAAPGTDEDKESAVAELSRIWKLRTGSSFIVRDDCVFFKFYFTISVYCECTLYTHSMYVCMYVINYANKTLRLCMCVCIYVCMYVRINVRMYVCMWRY